MWLKTLSHYGNRQFVLSLSLSLWLPRLYIVDFMIKFVNHTFFFSFVHEEETLAVGSNIHLYFTLFALSSLFFPLKIDRTVVVDFSTESVMSPDAITCHTRRTVRRNALPRKNMPARRVTRARFIEKCRGDAPSGQSFCELLTTRSCIRCTRCIHTHIHTHTHTHTRARSCRRILHQHGNERGICMMERTLARNSISGINFVACSDVRVSRSPLFFFFICLCVFSFSFFRIFTERSTFHEVERKWHCFEWSKN